jgi:tRNA nucleotidyltransferase (CCA-adding enzyme)
MDALQVICTLSKMSSGECGIAPEQAKALHATSAQMQLNAPQALQAQLLALLAGKNVVSVLLEFGDCLAAIIPEIGATIGFNQKSRWHCYDVWEHTVHALAAAQSTDPLVHLALLFHDLGKPICFTVDETGNGHFYGHSRAGAQIARQRLRQLGFGESWVQAISELVSLHLEHLDSQKVENWYLRIGLEQLDRLLAVKYADMAAHEKTAAQARLAELDEFASALARWRREAGSGAGLSTA